MNPPRKQNLQVLLSAFAVVIGIAAIVSLYNRTARAAVPPLTVVELFQSQGCSSCPPANANVLTLTDRPDLLILSFGVTYWDQLGWKDTFANAANTQRQHDYATGSLKHPNVFTPQVIINGRYDLVGTNLAELKEAIAQASLPAGGPKLTLSAQRLIIAPGVAPKHGANIWLVRYDPRTVQVEIKRGENGGRTLPHRNVVHELVSLGVWNGRATELDVPPSPEMYLRTAILVQVAEGGPILAALK